MTHKYTRVFRIYASFNEYLFTHKLQRWFDLSTECGLNMILHGFRSFFMYIFKEYRRFVHENRCFSYVSVDVYLNMRQACKDPHYAHP